MHRDFFGDSHDYAKRVLLPAIAPPDKWVVHPMLFRKKGAEKHGGGLNTGEYARFLGLPVEAVLRGNCRTREDLVEDVTSRPEPYLFLDPDTGIHLKKGSTKHVTADQLRQIVDGRDRRIVLVFDHAFRDGGEAQKKVESKLECLRRNWGLMGSALVVREHRCVCFIWFSADRRIVDKYTERLQTALQFPKHKFVFSAS